MLGFLSGIFLPLSHFQRAPSRPRVSRRSDFSVDILAKFRILLVFLFGLIVLA
jgi:hypothetical protein